MARASQTHRRQPSTGRPAARSSSPARTATGKTGLSLGSPRPSATPRSSAPTRARSTGGWTSARPRSRPPTAPACRTHGLDLVDPDEPFTAADFQRYVYAALPDIAATRPTGPSSSAAPGSTCAAWRAACRSVRRTPIRRSGRSSRRDWRQAAWRRSWPSCRATRPHVGRAHPSGQPASRRAGAGAGPHRGRPPARATARLSRRDGLARPPAVTRPTRTPASSERARPSSPPACSTRRGTSGPLWRPPASIQRVRLSRGSGRGRRARSTSRRPSRATSGARGPMHDARRRGSARSRTSAGSTPTDPVSAAIDGRTAAHRVLSGSIAGGYAARVPSTLAHRSGPAAGARLPHRRRHRRRSRLDGRGVARRARQPRRHGRRRGRRRRVAEPPPHRPQLVPRQGQGRGAASTPRRRPASRCSSPTTS